MAVYCPDSRFCIDLRAFYVKSLVTEGLRPNVMNEVEVKETLDRFSGKYDNGMIEPLKKVGTVSMKYLGEVRKALATMAAGFNGHIIILPWNNDTVYLPRL